MRQIVRAAVNSLAALGLLVGLVTVTPLTLWWAARLAGHWTDAKGDTLIVVGGSSLGSGMIGDSLLSETHDRSFQWRRMKRCWQTHLIEDQRISRDRVAFGLVGCCAESGSVRHRIACPPSRMSFFLRVRQSTPPPEQIYGAKRSI